MRLTPGDESRFVVYGAGCIGAYLGGWLLAAGYRVAFVRRTSFEDASRFGFGVQDRHARQAHIVPDSCTLITPTEIGPGDTVLVTVKSGATDHVAAELSTLSPGSIVSVQNGISNVSRLQATNPGVAVAGAMIPFNIIRTEDNIFRQTTTGRVLIGPQGQHLANALLNAGVDAAVTADIEAIQAGKLLMNLNNAIHALSGVSLSQELSSRDYRVVLAAAQREALEAFRLHRTPVASPLSNIAPRLIPTLLRTPDMVFNRIARPLLDSDADASSSLRDDLLAGKKTEVRFLNGEIVDMLERMGHHAHVNQTLVQLVEHAEKDGQPSAISGPRLREEILRSR
ncbi:2-dehydropantoate 2-reductase [Nocardia sp. NEAU-G5]|uniref:2-dehydropantoate 2-reductase n=1 Tax=Nocardia albiluteola TaxID=2842303 RepID=A0ABS6BC02_9NOCA|nr:2-dehydropantoate 2-reductase [Nocardia albiluteola]MBU3067821.1 2-dehydropantoate 2-reductase [Nocardia albiluteola]